MPIETLTHAFVAGLLASLACGLGVFPLLLPRLDPRRHTGIAYAGAGGLMFAASVYNLILPGLKGPADDAVRLGAALPVISGILLGALFLAGTQAVLARRAGRAEAARAGGPNHGAELLVFIAMTVHSIPEGVAVGVGYASGDVHGTSLGNYIALAIGIHNIPEGLAVAVPLRARGVGLWTCFFAAVATSLPQPLAAVPAGLVSWLFQPLMPVLMGFAAGAMIFLVVVELIPDALAVSSPRTIAWAFTIGFCAMLLLQVVL